MQLEMQNGRQLVPKESEDNYTTLTHLLAVDEEDSTRIKTLSSRGNANTNANTESKGLKESKEETKAPIARDDTNEPTAKGVNQTAASMAVPQENPTPKESPPAKPIVSLVSPHIEQDPVMSPEHLVGNLPLALHNRATERLLSWEQVPVSPTLSAFIERLDAIEVHSLHDIGFLYIPPKCRSFTRNSIFYRRSDG